MVPEHYQRLSVGRNGVVVEVAADDPPKPFPLFGDRPVHTPSIEDPDVPELAPWRKDADDAPGYLDQHEA